MAMPLTVPRYTVEQVRAFPKDGNRYELLDGMLLVTPAPGNLHQCVVSNLLLLLLNQVARPGAGRVVSPGELEVGKNLLLDPDILVYPVSYRPGTHWKFIRGWWLAVEVLSRSTRVYDREFKRPAYQALGVEEVWLVDPDSRTVEVWIPTATAPVIVSEVIRWRPAALGSEVTIPLSKVFPERSL
jgi:Uma2 family endonuclease